MSPARPPEAARSRPVEPAEDLWAAAVTYTSHADLGGQQMSGAIVTEPEGQPFHAAWEARAMALTLAMGATGAWNIDTSRAARETLPDYAQLDYYRIWLSALQRLIEARGLADAGEMACGHAMQSPKTVARVLQASDVPHALARGTPTARAATQPARFALGDRVRTRPDRPDHHTRLPGYARGRVGTVERLHGVHVFADAHARGLGEQPQWLYGVRFEAADLWPQAADRSSTVAIDAWEPYLEPA